MRFTKMHGLGNDYVFINCFSERVPGDIPSFAREVSDRHFGVGSDGVILILPSSVADFMMRIFNSDGSEGEMCGNGIRCFAKYVFERGLTPKTEIRVETLAGIISCTLHLKGGKVDEVTVDMGFPRLRPDEIPVSTKEAGGLDRVVDRTLVALDREFSITAVSMGNPHCVVFLDSPSEAILERYGPVLETHPFFPSRTNVEFASVVSPGEVEVLVWERGSGKTMACGTGACAVTVAGALKGLLDREAAVRLPGGLLRVRWEEDGRVYMRGPCEEVFDGIYLGRGKQSCGDQDGEED